MVNPCYSLSYSEGRTHDPPQPRRRRHPRSWPPWPSSRSWAGRPVNAYHEVYSDDGAGLPPGPALLGRATRGEVILRPRFQAALSRLNPNLPQEAYTAAFDELARDRSAMTLVDANRDIYDLLKEGLPVTFRDPDGESSCSERLRHRLGRARPTTTFSCVQQFWVTGDVYTRRADLVGFVNGLPLFFGELKAHHRSVEDAYRKNLSDYKDTIPHLFWYNAFILLSNGSDARIGTLTSDWEHFGQWKKINREGEEGVISLETAIRGTCPPARFLDLAEMRHSNTVVAHPPKKKKKKK